MPARRILLLRSGRHLRVAIDALAARHPGCHVGVVGTPGSEAAIEQAGVAPGDRFVYPTRFQPLAFLVSLTALRARRWGYDRVAVLWNDPDGTGQGNVNRTALAMSPRGYLAIAPDGAIVERSLWPQVRTECLRMAASIGVVIAMAVLLYVPAALLSLFRRVTGPAKAGHYVRHASTDVVPGFSRAATDVVPGFSRATTDVVPGFSRAPTDVAPDFSRASDHTKAA